MPASRSSLVKAKLVNWLPWSVLKISSSASVQNPASSVFDSRQARTWRLVLRFHTLTDAAARLAVEVVVSLSSPSEDLRQVDRRHRLGLPTALTRSAGQAPYEDRNRKYMRRAHAMRFA